MTFIAIFQVMINFVHDQFNFTICYIMEIKQNILITGTSAEKYKFPAEI